MRDAHGPPEATMCQVIKKAVAAINEELIYFYFKIEHRTNKVKIRFVPPPPRLLPGSKICPKQTDFEPQFLAFEV